MSKTIEIAIPDEVFLGLRKTPQELASELRLAAAVKWYETGAVSQGKGAEIAGVSRAEFIEALSRFSVSPFQETAKEVLDAAREGEE
ncbi:MAG: UPF0175 family protein [Deltaproteobacteria bacterium]|nr:UPF0175 family protein [Deltaproteobacteria bacterium]